MMVRMNAIAADVIAFLTTIFHHAHLPKIRQLQGANMLKGI